MITVMTVSAYHERLLSLVLSDVLDGIEARVISQEDEDAARPLARQLLMFKRQPLIFAIDAGTVDGGRVGAHQRELEAYFDWGATGLPFQVVQFVPEIETIFFQRPQVLERLRGRPVPAWLRTAGVGAPRALLVGLHNGRFDQRLEELTYAELCQLRSHPSIAAIREFVVANAEPALARRSA